MASTRMFIRGTAKIIRGEIVSSSGKIKLIAS